MKPRKAILAAALGGALSFAASAELTAAESWSVLTMKPLMAASFDAASKSYRGLFRQRERPVQAHADGRRRGEAERPGVPPAADRGPRTQRPLRRRRRQYSAIRLQIRRNGDDGDQHQERRGRSGGGVKAALRLPLLTKGIPRRNINCCTAIPQPMRRDARSRIQRVSMERP